MSCQGSWNGEWSSRQGRRRSFARSCAIRKLLRGFEWSLIDRRAEASPTDPSCLQGQTISKIPQRHHNALRGAGCRRRQGDGRMLQPSPASGVPEIPAQTRPGIRKRRATASGYGQLWHPQACQGADVVGEAAPLPPSLHPDEFKLAQSSGTLVRRTDQQSRSAG